ncbi:MAG: PKD domain-containing protein [Cyanobacteria bacterium]|nr:PKD domain-containing protein [Cyanobacteriota bacterium]
MRTTTFVSLIGAVALAAAAGCTVKDVEQPALAGPSTFATSIIMVADRNTLTQNGVDFTDIRITALGPDGQSLSIPLSAQIFLGGQPADFGTLSTKTPVTPATVRFTAPPASPIGVAQVTTVTFGVTPRSAGDFRGEMPRQLDIQLLPQGVILPTNPNLVAAFTFTPATPQVGQVVAFDASTSTNSGTACGISCSYAWDFGDGTGGTGLTTTHTFGTQGSFAVKLTITDSRGSSAAKTNTVPVAAPTPPTGTVTVSPTPAPTNTDVFFNASGITWPGRQIVSYSWNFGDGTSGSGVTTTHRFAGIGSYTVVLTLRDASGATSTINTTVSVTSAANGTAAFTVTPTSPRVGQSAAFNASTSTPSTGATIVSYKWNYGDGTEETTANPIQSHVYGAAGTVNVQLTTTDSNGKTNTVVNNVVIQP